VPDPPPGVNTNLPPVTEAKPQTNRDRMTEHATEFHVRYLPQIDGCRRFWPREVRCCGRTARTGDPGISEKDEDDGEDGTYRSCVITLTIHECLTSRASRIRSFRRQLNSWARFWRRVAQCQECMVKQYFRLHGRANANAPADRPLIRKVTDDFPQFRIPVPGACGIVNSHFMREFKDQADTQPSRGLAGCRK
jgi:hypothetical protein